MDWAWTVNIYYRCGTAYGGSSTGSLTNTNAPGWQHRGRSSNFLFKDGHIQAYSYTGTELFTNNDYIPVK
jgi:prepilin-type processing-associated H-X9-DG protein